jgi:uncharacterized membrane protein
MNRPDREHGPSILRRDFRSQRLEAFSDGVFLIIAVFFLIPIPIGRRRPSSGSA